MMNEIKIKKLTGWKLIYIYHNKKEMNKTRLYDNSVQ